MRQHGSLMKDEETSKAAWEAARGAVTGAARWGAVAAVAGGLGFAFSPIYRGLTVQFKVFLQMSGMILGSMIEADKRLIAYEHRVRHQRRMARDMQVWRQYEEEFERRGVPGVGGEGNVKGRDPDA
ncbi:hypothetical protein BDV95DRAFT_129129 [Massariosphaeria phaeospora]|uniref:Uncharacterized protein n=1 Tax=Massariosphaeria phaeospora TaxID=100035 RepID=A0A7C8I6H1_9PLEO|nr:hypothetical protein BDV95DRAFT_129129 [Massariosphaeria phaeospora]